MDINLINNIGMEGVIHGHNKLQVREARPEDCRDIWEWWNDPVTRRMMKKNDVVGWEEHCRWFEEVSSDENRVLCVGISGNEKIGVIRFDMKAAGIYEVSINLSPLFRGKGYAALLLSEAIDYLKRTRRPQKLFAKMKKINTPSKRTFLRAGFGIVEDPRCDHSGMEDFTGETEHYCEMRF